MYQVRVVLKTEKKASKCRYCDLDIVKTSKEKPVTYLSLKTKYTIFKKMEKVRSCGKRKIDKNNLNYQD